MTRDFDVIIAGGGIGGLTLALTLHAVGIRSRVYESVAELAELGVGINILPHATKEYERLGVLDELIATGVELERYMWFNRHGQQIWSEPRGRKAGYPWPQVSIHRGTFHRILAETVRQRLGNDALMLDHHLHDFTCGNQSVRAHFVSRRSGTAHAPVEAPVMVAADGIHSLVRNRLYPEQGRPRWAGNMMWRMTVELERPLLGGNTMFSAGTGDIKVVAYEISAAAKARGRSLCNWIAEVKLGEADDPPPEREDWNRQATIDEFIDYFRGWRFEWLDVPALARASRTAWAFPMVDRDPVPLWTRQRITLLGDAAHPMWPIGSNGASQAVLDCRALADHMSSTNDIDAALAAYEAQRRPATAAVVHANRSRAHDRILDLVDARAPGGFTHIDDVATSEEIETILSGYRQTAQFDKKQLT